MMTKDRKQEETASSRVEGSLDAVFQQMLQPIQAAISQIDQRIAAESDGNKNGDDETGKVIRRAKAIYELVKPLDASLKARFDKLESTLSGKLAQLSEVVEETVGVLKQSVDALRDELADKPAGQSRPSEDRLTEMIFGSELSADESIAADRKQLLAEIDAGNAAARILTGRIMLASASPAEQLAPLMGDVGEAFYQWRPITSNSSRRFEQTLADWLMRRCREGGLQNTIELVSVGERFDTRRHQSDDRGGYVSAVHGWIVLRENGTKVYTRAKCAVE